MKHEINVNSNLRTDLAADIVNKRISHKDINVIHIQVDKAIEKIIHKKVGNYLTIEFKDITDIDNRNKVIDVFVKELKKMLKELNVFRKKCLVIGLGNMKTTPDSLGPKVVEKIVTTAYLKKIESKFSNVAAYSVGVKGETGFSSVDIVKALVKIFKPDFILVIDALVSKNLDRLNKTIQIADVGINPGSGVSNNQKEISEKTLNVKTISIGVPTVVELDKNMMVTAKDIDFLIENLSDIIAIGINRILHEKLDSKWQF